MSPETVISAREALREFVLDLNPEFDEAKLQGDTPLLETRLLTSRNVLELLLLVESLREAPIDPRTLVPRTFADIDSIVATLLTGES